MTCGSATISPAVPPAIPRVGNQWRPFANWTGNNQMSFWSRRKSLGRLRQETSRLDGESPLSFTAACAAMGASGKFESGACAQTQLGAQKTFAQKTKIDRRFANTFTEMLGCKSWPPCRLGCD